MKKKKKSGKCIEILESLSNEKDNDDAMLLLADIYIEGKEVAMQKERAIKLFEESAKRGNKIAISSFGQLYLEGIHLEKNLEKAKLLFIQAAS